MPEERTIGYYLRPLRGHVLLIALVVLVAVFASALLWAASTSHMPYEAEALVIFKTLNSGRLDLTQSTDPQFRDTNVDIVRMQKNVGVLAYSMDVANNVIKKAQSSSDPDVKALAAGGPLELRDMVSVQPKGDFVSVKAQAPTAAAATWLANTWAQEAILRVNTVYAAPTSNVSQAVDDVKAQLDSDQKALQDFMASNPINSLSQELSQTTSFIDAATQSGASTDFTLYDAERQGLRDQISSNYTTTNTLDQQLNEMQALRSRIQQGPGDQSALSANQVALMLILNKVISGNSGSQVQLQLNITDLGKGPLSRGSQLSDIDATISAVQKLRDDVQSQTRQLEAKLSTPVPAITPAANSSASLLQSYIKRQGELESELSQKQFELDQLTKTRDLHQTTYDLLRSRAAEQQVNGMVSGVVDIGWAADESQTVRAHSPLRTLALDVLEWGLIALVFGAALAYLLSLAYPNFSSNRAISGLFLRRPRPQATEPDKAARVSSGG